MWDEAAAGVRVVRLRVGRAFVSACDQPPRAPRGGAVHHLGLETNDLAALVARMKARGHVFHHPIRHPIRHKGAFDEVMASSADGLLLERFQCHEPARWRIGAPPVAG